MQALVFVAAGTVEMQDIPIVEPRPEEVTVHVRASAICGSELHGFRSVGMRVPPLVMGHEFAGVTDDGRTSRSGQRSREGASRSSARNGVPCGPRRRSQETARL